MSRKLIATHFVYEMRDALNKPAVYVGSYLGRKVASKRTLQEFLNANGARTFSGRVLEISYFYESQWIAR